MKIDTREVYIADDGTEFYDYYQCLKYEKQLAEIERKTSYWKIVTDPDLCEGRGYQKNVYVKCYGFTDNTKIWLEDYCYRKYGRPLSFIQGIESTKTWILHETTKKDFQNPDGVSIGGYYIEPDVIELELVKENGGFALEQK